MRLVRCGAALAHYGSLRAAHGVFGEQIVSKLLSDEEWRARLMAEAARARGVSVAPAPAAPACSFHMVRAKLEAAGLRPTRQRMTVGWLLFGKGDRHTTAETLYQEAAKTKANISLATVYNTLKQFSEAGLVREIALYGSRLWYDTKTGAHQHFYVEGEEHLLDIPADDLSLADVQAPEGMEIVSVDVIVRVRPKRNS